MNPLTKLLRKAPKVYLLQTDKAIFISDLHMGIRDKADDFQRNEVRCIMTLDNAYHDGYFLFILGDYVELYENDNLQDIITHYPTMWGIVEQFKAAGRLYRVVGNHDKALGGEEAYHVLTGNGNYCVAHGHQMDFWNSGWRWYISKWVVRHIWRGLQYIGFHDPTKSDQKRHGLVEQKLYNWCSDNEVRSIFGHVHKLCTTGFYNNCGSWVGDGGEALVLENGILKSMRWR